MATTNRDKRRKNPAVPIAPYREEGAEALICTVCGQRVPPGEAAAAQMGAFLCDPCLHARPKPPRVTAITRSTRWAVDHFERAHAAYRSLVQPVDDAVWSLVRMLVRMITELDWTGRVALLLIFLLLVFWWLVS